MLAVLVALQGAVELGEPGEGEQLLDGVGGVLADDDGLAQDLLDGVFVQAACGGEAAAAVLADRRPVAHLGTGGLAIVFGGCMRR